MLPPTCQFFTPCRILDLKHFSSSLVQMDAGSMLGLRVLSRAEGAPRGDLREWRNAPNHLESC